MSHERSTKAINYELKNKYDFVKMYEVSDKILITSENKTLKDDMKILIGQNLQ